MIFFQKELEQNLAILRDVEISFEEALHSDVSASFFNRNQERLSVLRETLNRMEETWQRLQNTENYLAATFLGDKINKRIYADVRNALSFNDRFRFQRDLFEGDTGLMKDTLEDINQLQSLPDAFSYLDQRFNWNWENESAQAFKEILEKKFT